MAHRFLSFQPVLVKSSRINKIGTATAVEIGKQNPSQRAFHPDKLFALMILPLLNVCENEVFWKIVTIPLQTGYELLNSRLFGEF
jgi:hypothetical protein